MGNVPGRWAAWMGGLGWGAAASLPPAPSPSFFLPGHPHDLFLMPFSSWIYLSSALLQEQV